RRPGEDVRLPGRGAVAAAFSPPTPQFWGALGHSRRSPAAMLSGAVQDYGAAAFTLKSPRIGGLGAVPFAAFIRCYAQDHAEAWLMRPGECGSRPWPGRSLPPHC